MFTAQGHLDHALDYKAIEESINLTERACLSIYKFVTFQKELSLWFLAAKLTVEDAHDSRKAIVGNVHCFWAGAHAELERDREQNRQAALKKEAGDAFVVPSAKRTSTLASASD